MCLGRTCIGERREGGGAAEDPGGDQLRLVASSSGGAVEAVEVWIHRLGLPEVGPLHRRQDTILQQAHENEQLITSFIHKAHITF